MEKGRKRGGVSNLDGTPAYSVWRRPREGKKESFSGRGPSRERINYARTFDEMSPWFDYFPRRG